MSKGIKLGFITDKEQNMLTIDQKRMLGGLLLVFITLLICAAITGVLVVTGSGVEAVDPSMLLP